MKIFNLRLIRRLPHKNFFSFTEKVILISIFLNFFLAIETKAEAPFTIARLKYGGGGDWYTDPTSIPNLLRALKDRTNIECLDDEKVLSLNDPDLFSYPFLYLTGHGNIRFNQKEREILRRYLLNGGFLWADDCYGMDPYFRKEIELIFAEDQVKLVALPFDHPIYHSFYDFPSGPPKIHEHSGGPPEGLGIIKDGRLLVFYTYNTDIGDGLESPAVHNDPPEKREMALCMAINVVVYALTN